MSFDFTSNVYTKALVPAVLGVSGAMTTSSVDMKTCRTGYLIISATIAAGDDVASLSLTDSSDNSTFAAVSPAVTVAALVADAVALDVYNVPRMKRYVKFLYTPTISGSSYICVLLVGTSAVRSPVS